ncbi:MAG: hypothetical protein E4H14_07330 [Candidatus Thorarchaeota archaeon]|nr:MAG: hypothetical protein E4H14_07330 [Candidatus Thorarchaeota archaeon]
MVESDSPDLEDAAVDIGFRLSSKLGRVMERKEDDPEENLELYGTSPRVIAILLGLMTLLFPVGGIGLIYNWTGMHPLLYGTIWVSPVENFLFAFVYYLFHPWELLSTIWITIPLCTFNFLFIIQINRWFYGKTSRDIVLFYGILSIVAPSAISLALWVTIDFAFIITPLPFQFLAGMLLLHKFRDPDYVSPWKGYYLDWSWWTRQQHSIDDPNPKVINLTQLLMQHDADWLEGWLDEE